MPSRRAGRLISLLAAAALAVVIGSAATADPETETTRLAPTASLPASGGATAPVAGGGPGGAEAPSPQTDALSTAPAAGSAPPADPAPPLPSPPDQPLPPAPAGTDAPPPAGSAPGAAWEPEGAAPDDTDPDVLADGGVPGDADGHAPADTVAPELPEPGPAREQLVPVAVLSAPVAQPAETEPLIDISPTQAGAPALVGVAQVEQDDDEVEIPVPPEDFEDDDDENAGGGQGGAGAGGGDADTTVPGSGQSRAGTLALTGRAIGAPIVSALLLLVLGFGLRAAAPPSARVRA